MKKKIVIYGKGDFAKLMYHYFKTDSKYNVVAFCVDKPFKNSDTYCKLPLISCEDMYKKYPNKNYQSFVAVGYSNMRIRKIMFDKIKDMGYTCVNYISSKANVDKSLLLGENNVILQGSTIEPFVKINNNNIIWSSVTISHDVKIKSHSFFASQSLVGGFSIIKNNCFIAFKSTIINNIILDKETLLGSCSLQLTNTKKYTQYFGSPTKAISTHKKYGIRLS